MMNSPTALVAAALTAAILLTASLLIAAGARGETVPAMRGQNARIDPFGQQFHAGQLPDRGPVQQ
jgi:hypothetical protein